MLFVQDEQKGVLNRMMQRLGDAVFEEKEEDSNEGWPNALGGWGIQTAAASLNSQATVWTDLPDYVFEQVVAHVQADRASSMAFRQVCRACGKPMTSAYRFSGQNALHHTRRAHGGILQP